MPRVSLFAAAMVLVSTACAHASSLAGTTTGRGANSAPYYGQSFTVAGTGQFDDIAINFYDTSLQPYAIGTGYLFSSLYTGTTGGLSTSTANLLGTADSSGGVWTFAPSLTLTAGVMYYFYENGAMPLNTTYGVAPYTTGTEYYSFGPTNTYTAEPGLAKDFLVTGTAVTPASVTPEPSSLLMLATGLAACVGSTVRRSRRSA